MRVSTLNKIYYTYFFEASILNKEIGLKNTLLTALISILVALPGFYLLLKEHLLLLCIHTILMFILTPRLVNFFLREIKFLEKDQTLKEKMKTLKFSLFEESFPPIASRANHYIAMIEEDIKKSKDHLGNFSWPASVVLILISEVLKEHSSLLTSVLVLTIQSFGIYIVIHSIFFIFYRGLLLNFFEEYEEIKLLKESN